MSDLIELHFFISICVSVFSTMKVVIAVNDLGNSEMYSIV